MTLLMRLALALVLAAGVAMPALAADEKHGDDHGKPPAQGATAGDPKDGGHAPAGGDHKAGDDHKAGGDHGAAEHGDGHGKGYHHLNLHAVAVQTLGFALLAFILGRFALPPVQKALEARRAKIADTFEKLEADEAGLGDRRADAEYAAREVERGAAERVERAIREGSDLREQLVAEGEETARKIAEKAVVEREIEENMLTLELRNETVDLSFEAAERVLAKAVDKKTQEQLVDAFIDSLGKVAR